MREVLKFATTLMLAAGIHSGVAAAVSYQPSLIIPPKPLREFRAAWIPAVGENSWLLAATNTAQQKAAIVAMMDRAAALKLNAIIFQVRPACDALYASKIEPWSEQLTGKMGQPPSPYYDPLAFAIAEAHKRGLELHAWFNPYRALYSTSSPLPSNQITRKRPDLVRKYASVTWLDPGERDVQDYTLSVIMDVVRRYDVDGVHFDDYFYPYPEINESGKVLDFPDDASWRKFGAGGKLSRGDWRRENVNAFVQRTYNSIKAAKPWLMFGISPFGIWRPGNPPPIKGLDAYALLYADSRKWLSSGWVDYLAPQLYWPIEPPQQSFTALLKWWAEQNTDGRILVAGLNTANVGIKWKPEELLQQIGIARHQPDVSGQIHWSMMALMRNSDLVTMLRRSVYTEPALLPECPRSVGAVEKPSLKPMITARSKHFEKSVKVNWSASTNETVAHWVLQFRNGNDWTMEILTPNQTSRVFVGDLPNLIAVSSVNRSGGLSAPAAIALKKN